MEKRRSARRRILKTGYIVFSNKAPKLECAVRNISETGALLQVSATAGIPNSFDVIIDGVRRRCSVVRNTETRLGIAFR